MTVWNFMSYQTLLIENVFIILLLDQFRLGKIYTKKRIIKKLIQGHQQQQQQRNRNVVEEYLMGLPPSYTLYHLVVIHSLLMPGAAHPDILSDTALKFQNSFILAGIPSVFFTGVVQFKVL